jgi:hypothetical protein
MTAICTEPYIRGDSTTFRNRCIPVVCCESAKHLNGSLSVQRLRECAAVGAQVQPLDERARRPISGYAQDAIRVGRTRLTWSQYTRHC